MRQKPNPAQQAPTAHDRRGNANDGAAMPASIGDYELMFPLAQGPVGQEYLARKAGSASKGQMAIVKTLRQDLAEQQSFASLFRDAARVAQALRHPNIVQVCDAGVADGTHYIATQHVRGDTLQRVLAASAEQGEALSNAFIAAVVRDVALALDYAHHALTDRDTPRAVHSDISPANIVVGHDGMARVINFGIASLAIRKAQAQLGGAKGGTCYMSPEQAQGRRDLDGRSDQFSLGAVSWELFAGRPLFGASTPDRAVHKLLKATVPRPSQFRADVPQQLERVVMRMLQRDIEKRYPRCAAVAAEMNTFLRDQPVADVTDHVAQRLAAAVGAPLDTSGHDEVRVESPRAPRNTSLTPTMKLPVGKPREPDTVPNTSWPDTESRPWPSIPIRGVLAVLAAAAAMFAAGGLWFHTATVPPPEAAPPADAPPAKSAAPNPTPPPSLPEKRGPLAQSLFEQLPDFLRWEPARARLKVTSEPSGAVVRIDGVLAGKTPLAVDTLAPGVLHTVQVSLPDRRPQTEQVWLEPGEKGLVHVRLGRSPKPLRQRR
jgi:serine/threonine-protein kinase